ncbi:DUF1453 domain-containing protein (plasmid) [Streptomyces sp. BI20]|uniref:DUF1453 domain-containing protein n=1 Tax=Streptomyces sp. BI20 TaxID=3403460 RepID=UPI003C730B88
MSAFNILVIIAVVALILVRQFRPQRWDPSRRWWLVPVVLGVFAVRGGGLIDSGHTGLSIALLAAEIVTGALMGVGWAWTTRVWKAEDGSVWTRGTKATAAVWVGGLVIRLGLAGLGVLLGLHLGTGAMLLALAASLLVRSGVMVLRHPEVHASYRGRDAAVGRRSATLPEGPGLR